jgi:hypothetical protein
MTSTEPTILILPALAVSEVLASTLTLASSDRILPVLCNVQLRIAPAAEGFATIMGVATDRYVLGYCRRTVKVDSIHEAVTVLVDVTLAKDVVAMIRKTKTQVVRLWIENGRVEFHDGTNEVRVGARIFVEKDFPAVDGIMEKALDLSSERTVPLSLNLSHLAKFAPAAKIAKTEPVFWSSLGKDGREQMAAVRIGADFAGVVMPVRLLNESATPTARTFGAGFSL